MLYENIKRIYYEVYLIRNKKKKNSFAPYNFFLKKIVR